MARYQDDVGVRFRDSGRDRTDTNLGDQLDVYPCLRVGVLQVMDQLLQVFDRIDVVMRWR